MLELVADLIKEGADVNERNHVSLHAGVPLAWAWRRARVPARHVCARHSLRGDVSMQSCASVWLCRGSSVR